MPVRLRPDGIIEFDTVDEALAYRRGTDAAPTTRHVSMRPSQRALDKMTTQRGRGILNGVAAPPTTIEQATAHPIAVALHRAYPAMMSFNEVAKAINVEPASLTPQWGHLRHWIERASNGKLSFADFLIRTPNPQGGGSIFSLSPVGEDLMLRVIGAKK